MCTLDVAVGLLNLMRLHDATIKVRYSVELNIVYTWKINTQLCTGVVYI